MSSGRRVVITGLGMITSLGLNVPDTWKGLLSGESGVSMIDSFDASSFPCKFSASIKNFDPEHFNISKKDARKMDLFIQYGIAAAEEAIADSGMDLNQENRDLIGIALGSGIGGLITIENTHTAYLNGGARKISPFFIPATIINMLPGHVSIRNGLQGPNISIVSACTTGAHNIGAAARMIAYGDADVMVAGGSEMATCTLGVGGFAACRALSLRNDDPIHASRPWDKDRDGFVLGDGAGAMVLESYEHAIARGARIYAELIGFGMSADAYHMTSPPPDGEGARKAMINAMKDAKIVPESIDYINAHATSTPVGDECEVNAIKTALGEHAYNIAVSSTKSMIGHLLGAAGAVEAVISVLAIRDQIAPPTINLEHVSEGCDLDFIPNVSRPMKIDVALSNSFAFGGTNAALLFRRLNS